AVSCVSVSTVRVSGFAASLGTRYWTEICVRIWLGLVRASAPPAVSSVAFRFGITYRFFFFFFQAEDGIRDPLVTGVQTCALPILERMLAHAIPTPAMERSRSRGSRITATESNPSAPQTRQSECVPLRPSTRASPEIGRASCRERGKMSGGAGRSEKKNKEESTAAR